MTFFDFTFPEEIAGAPRINVHDYEATEPGLGYSASYRQGGMTATVYIYDDGKPFIPDDPQSLLVVAQHQGLVGGRGQLAAEVEVEGQPGPEKLDEEGFSPRSPLARSLIVLEAHAHRCNVRPAIAIRGRDDGLVNHDGRRKYS